MFLLPEPFISVAKMIHNTISYTKNKEDGYIYYHKGIYENTIQVNTIFNECIKLKYASVFYHNNWFFFFNEHYPTFVLAADDVKKLAINGKVVGKLRKIKNCKPPCISHKFHLINDKFLYKLKGNSIKELSKTLLNLKKKMKWERD